MSNDANMLSALTEAAFGLGMAYHDKHEQAEDAESEARCFAAFDRCFTSVRLAIALKLRLGREARASAREPTAERDEVEREAVLEVDRPERYTERDRDRETERASFPLLLKTLTGVVADASAVPGPRPAELVSLRELLATAGATPASQPRPPPSALKARLTGSTATALLTLDRAAGAWPGIAPPRRATGPPGR